MPWTPSNKWSQEKKDAHDRNADEMNKVWGKINEKIRREGVADALFKPNKEEINNEATTSKNQSSTSKNNNQSQKM